MTIEPETKNWTWVLERECEECGFDTPAVDRDAIGQLTREAAAPWPSFMADPLARVRPRDDCWSALEYGCHVRDVFRLGSFRVGLMLNEDNPQFANWDQDEAAVSERYDLQDPSEVAQEILAAAATLADLYDTVSGDQWQRPSVRSDGSPFTVESFGRYMLHDPIHHIADAQRGFEDLRRTRDVNSDVT
jgi:DinB superfamily